MKYIKYFYSFKGIVLLFFMLLFINAAMLKVNLRWDITEDKLYSLSGGTKNILNKLEQDITLKLFSNRSLKDAPFFLKNYIKRATDFLSEYQKAGKGKIKLEIYDTVMDSEEEEKALKYGIKPIELLPGENIYFGLVADAGGKTEVIPFIDPSKEERLEYEITRSIADAVETSSKKKIGIISGLSVFGEASLSFNIEALPDNAGWHFINELKESYEAIKINPDGDALNEDIDLLIIIHPKNLNEKLQYKIDQYILTGKNALIFVDPLSVSDAASNNITASSFNKFFSAWKIGINENEILADFDFAAEIINKKGFKTDNPYFISPKHNAFNKNSVIVSRLETMLFPFAGSIFKEKNCPYDFEPLIISSANSNMDANFTSHFDLDKIKARFTPSKEKYNLAVQISGKFDTAFPNKRYSDENNTEPSLKKGIDNSTIIIVADTDILYDDYYISKGNFFGFDTSEIFNDNLNFLLNAAEALVGSDLLISVRTIGRFERPFTKALEIEEKAKEKWFVEEQKLMEKAEEVNARLNSLEADNFYDMEAEIIDKHSKEIEEFELERIKVEKKLKEVRKKLREDMEKLEGKIKFFNIAFIPLFITIAGLIFGFYRKKREV
ncbi:MAG: Gldg family protein [Deltaproteobacteria bacterium]|nr:Gldg family protein [Deltaproteobacteria bacterium]